MAAELGDRLHHIPDGETGPRADWIVWQYPVLSSRPEFEVCPPGPSPHRALPRLRIRDGESIDTVRFGDLGYAQAAMSSFQRFAESKRDGQIPAHCRFQVSLPTPLAPIAAFVAPEDQSRIEPLYEARIVHELETLFDAIPHDQLAVQWDTNFEFAMLDGVMPTWFADPRSSIIERLVRLGRSIPADVALGYHFCHGHEGHHRAAALRRQGAGGHRQRPVAEPRPIARLGPPAGAGRARRRRLLRDHRPARPAPRDAAVSRAAPPRRRSRRCAGAPRRRPAVRPRLRGGDRLRVEPAPPTGRAAAHRAASGHVVADPHAPTAPGRRSHGRPVGTASPTRTGRLGPSTRSARRTTTSPGTAGTATSIRPSRSSPTWWSTGRSSSTTPAGRGSSSTA